MLKGRSFAKKTRTGQVVSVVREHYLRDDIPCSVKGCAACPPVPEPVLAAEAKNNAVIGAPHLLVPDTNVLLHQIDVVEHAYFTDVIVLQTVLDEIRHRNPAVHERVKTLLADPSRRFYLFSNEHHRGTYIEKNPDESPNDRNDRAIRTAAKWYDSHLAVNFGRDSALGIALITDDADNRRKAIEDGLAAFSVRDYVEGISGFPELHDMLAGKTTESQGPSEISYPEHLTPLHLSAGLKDGRLLQGTFAVSHHNVLEASIFAEVEGQERQVLIKGRLHQNRAMQGDAVVIELLPKAEWAQGEEEVALEEDDETHMTMAKEADADVRMFDATDEEVVASSAVPCAKVVGILRRAWRPLCGIVDAQSAGRAQEGQAANVLFIPVDRRLPRIRIRTRQGKQLLGKRIAVAVDGWARSSKYPAGHYIRTIGDIGDRETETEVLLLEHDVAYAPFSQHVLRCLPPEAENYRISDEELAARRDLRDLDVCSIDPPGCTDIDDALHCRPLPNGNLEVGVHIADVGHFVMPGNAMDEEAARRGTTVYLVDRRIDMLPSLLGTNLCSLRCNVDRLAFSCIWELTPDAKIVGVTFSKSVIHSKASLTYEEAQARIEDISRTDPLTVSIRALNALAKKLRAARIARGALTLASPEVRFRLENDSQDPLDVELKELKETNALVEEFMLLANISVAKQIFSHFPDFSLLRRHPSPSQPSFDPLKKALSQIGLSLDTETSKTLADSLDVAALPDDPYFNKLLRIMTTRCMMQAVYFCSGKVPENEFWHYGLATEIYTHFTSPIRRYADVIVHRLLAASIAHGGFTSSSLADKGKIDDLCANLNFRHRMAQQASRSSVELYTQLYFKGKVLDEEGHVIRVLRNGFAVLVPKYGIEGIVYTSDKDETGDWHFDAERQELRKDDVLVHVFKKVGVRITVQETAQQGSRSKVVVQLTDPFVEGLSPRQNEEPVHAGVKRKVETS